MSREGRYAKLASHIIHSSIWGESGDTCKVWITFLALKNREGMVYASIGGIARVCNLEIDFVAAAVAKF